jgi:hypothetical protein
MVIAPDVSTVVADYAVGRNVTIHSANTKFGTRIVISYIMYSDEPSSQLNGVAHVP